MINRLSYCAAMYCVSLAAHAVPSVSGNTISWPDDGWYQVQNTGDYTTICNGGTSCEVEPGTYKVINHSTGEKFRGIVVTGSGSEEPEEPEDPEDPPASVTVNGNTISWPDDGWYQVQNSTDYTTVCSGGTSCEVEPGTYKVVNHSTGEKFRGIVVTGSDPEEPPVNASGDITPFSDIYTKDGYDTINVVRFDAKIELSSGECTEADYTGCTLIDVLNDTDAKDNFKPELQIHLSGADFPIDGLFTNASFRQRGNSTRLADQKSFRIKLDSKDNLWRDERRLLLNKHPYESTRIRNKLAFDLMSSIPNLRSLRTQFVNLWVDEGAGPVDYGLFTHVEAPSNEYLKIRGLDKDDNLYKANFFGFAENDLSSLKVDEDGDPIDEEKFETRLDIKSGKDHSKLSEMIEALHDPNTPFDEVLNKYFNRNNVLTWLAVNFLLHHSEAIRHNYILYNPNGTDKFYFLPWDYDGALVTGEEPMNSFEHRELKSRLEFGYARGVKNEFIERFYKQPNTHNDIVATAEMLRRDYLTDAAIDAKALEYATTVDPFASRTPDIEFNPKYDVNTPKLFSEAVADNLDMLRYSYSVPLPPTVLEPTFENNEWTISWKPAVDITGNDVNYELIVASSVNFEPDSIAYETYIAGNDNAIVEVLVDGSFLADGDWYIRVIARSEADPDRFWQVNNNVIDEEEETYYGVLAFNSVLTQ